MEGEVSIGKPLRENTRMRRAGGRRGEKEGRKGRRNTVGPTLITNHPFSLRRDCIDPTTEFSA